MLGHTVETIVNHGLIVSQVVVFLQLMVKVTALRPESHVVHNGSGASAGCRHGAVIEIIHCPGTARQKVHMGMYIHTSRDNILSLCFNDLSPFCLQIPSYACNGFTVN